MFTKMLRHGGTNRSFKDIIMLILLFTFKDVALSPVKNTSYTF